MPIAEAKAQDPTKLLKTQHEGMKESMPDDVKRTSITSFEKCKVIEKISDKR